MKQAAAVVLTALILLSCAAVYAAGKTEGDTLVSRDYMTEVYIPDVVRQAEERVDAGIQAVYQSALDGLNSRHSAYCSGESSSLAALIDRRLKRGDVVTLSQGSGALLLAGSASVSCSAGGAAIDVTAGRVLSAGESFPTRHRVLAGEQTTAAVTVTSDTAVLSFEGPCTFSSSGATDYNALADALREMGLFRGTGTAYGSGYDLEAAPTRVVGLVMFLRLIGEEQAALAYTGANPFADTPAWCDRYVAYAYGQGYAKGVGTSSGGTLYFAPDQPLSAGEYLTFVLRALGYRDSGAEADFSWSTALSKALECGVLNSAEYGMLTGSPFLRAQVVYVSYFSLSAPRKDGGGTLLDRLVSSANVDRAALYTVMNSVTVRRLGT